MNPPSTPLKTPAMARGKYRMQQVEEIGAYEVWERPRYRKKPRDWIVRKKGDPENKWIKVEGRKGVAIETSSVSRPKCTVLNKPPKTMEELFKLWETFCEKPGG